MTKSRWIVILLVLLFLTNGYWLYATIDTGVTLNDQTHERKLERRAATLLTSLLVEFPRDSGIKEGRRFLRQRYPDDLVKVVGDTIEVGGILLQYEGGRRLSRVSFM